VPEDDDPEITWRDGKKYKRSQVEQYIERARQSQSAEAKQRAEIQRKHDAQVAALQRAGVKDPEAFMQDPQAYMRQMHHDYVRQQIEDAQLDPRDIEIREFKQREAERAEQERAAAETKKKEEYDQAVTRRAHEKAAEMYEALDASDLPRDPSIVARMASLTIAAARMKERDPRVGDIPKEHLAQAVARSIDVERDYHIEKLRADPPKLVKEVSRYLSGVKLDGEQVAKLLGEANGEAYRKYLLQTAQSKFSPQPQQPQRRSAQIPDIPNRSHDKYHTLDELKAWKNGGANGARR
jgi:hypothetical protein